MCCWCAGYSPRWCGRDEVPDKKMAAPEGTAKFREETSCRSGKPLAALHNMPFGLSNSKGEIRRYHAQPYSRTAFNADVPDVKGGRLHV
jgi:hypothetical protein